MPTKDTSGGGSNEHGFDWNEVQVPDFDQPLDDSSAGTPEETVDDGDGNTEQPQSEDVESTTPLETDSPQPQDEDSGLDDTSGLDEVPEEFRTVVKAAIEAKAKQLQAGYTKKFQSLAEERSRVESLAKYLDESGSSADDIVKAAAAFRKLESAPGIRIMQGDKVLYEAAQQSPEEPDFDEMTPGEIARHYEQKFAQERERLLSEVNSKFKPIEEERALSNARTVGQTWRSQHKDISDDVLNIAVAKAREFEQMLPQKPDLSSVEALDKFMEPFIVMARQLKTRAATPTRKPQSSRTEVPHKATKAPSRKASNLAEMAEEAARKQGFSDVNDLMSTFRGD